IATQSIYVLCPLLILPLLTFLFFFFQAEDGIRDFHVTGVQTCALPICNSSPARAGHERVKNYRHEPVESRGQSRPRSQYAGTPATIMRRVTPVLPGSVRSALSTMSAEASRNSAGTNG